MATGIEILGQREEGGKQVFRCRVGKGRSALEYDLVLLEGKGSGNKGIPKVAEWTGRIAEPVSGNPALAPIEAGLLSAIVDTDGLNRFHESFVSREVELPDLPGSRLPKLSIASHRRIDKRGAARFLFDCKVGGKSRELFPYRLDGHPAGLSVAELGKDGIRDLVEDPTSRSLARAFLRELDPGYLAAIRVRRQDFTASLGTLASWRETIQAG